jgi:hypothetical protein
MENVQWIVFYVVGLILTLSVAYSYKQEMRWPITTTKAVATAEAAAEDSAAAAANVATAEAAAEDSKPPELPPGWSTSYDQWGNVVGYQLKNEYNKFERPIHVSTLDDAWERYPKYSTYEKTTGMWVPPQYVWARKREGGYEQRVKHTGDRTGQTSTDLPKGETEATLDDQMVWSADAVAQFSKSPVVNPVPIMLTEPGEQTGSGHG